MKRCGYCVGMKPGEARTGVASRTGRCPCCGQVAIALFDGDCTADHPPRERRTAREGYGGRKNVEGA